jgi:regulator of sigma E protease
LSIFTIERDGKTLEIEVFPIIATMERVRTIGIIPELPRDLPALVGSVYEGFPADIAKIKPGDELIKIDGQWVESTDQVSQYIQQNPKKEITIELLRNGEIITTVVTPKLAVLGENGQKMPMIGVAWSFPKKLLRETPLVQVRSVIIETLEILQKLVNPKSDIKLSNMSGPVGMGRIIYKSAKWDIRMVFWVVVIININLAIINLLPIPVLDGGHIVFSTIEKIRGRALPQNLMMSLQGAFVIALLSLMLYVTVFDGKRYVAEKKQEKSDISSVITPKLVPSENPDSESQ